MKRQEKTQLNMNRTSRAEMILAKMAISDQCLSDYYKCFLLA